MEKIARPGAAARTASLNVNKVQAAACIVSSCAVSIGLIYWAIRALF